MVPKRSIWLCNHDTEGRRNDCQRRCYNSNPTITDSHKHWFVIISKKNEQDFLTALPFTSNPSQESRNDGVTISSDDVTAFSRSPNTFVARKLTFALCNKICRIPRENLTENSDYGMLKKSKFNDLIWKIRENLNEAN